MFFFFFSLWLGGGGGWGGVGGGGGGRGRKGGGGGGGGLRGVFFFCFLLFFVLRLGVRVDGGGVVVALEGGGEGGKRVYSAGFALCVYGVMGCGSCNPFKMNFKALIRFDRFRLVQYVSIVEYRKGTRRIGFFPSLLRECCVRNNQHISSYANFG